MGFSDVEYIRPHVIDSDMTMDDKQLERVAKKVLNSRTQVDMQRLIRMVLSSPMQSGMDIVEVDGVTGLKDYKGKNTDVQTRIILQLAIDSIKGDEKKAKLLLDYAGYAPVKEQSISVETPQFFDDISAKMEISADSDAIKKLIEEDEE